MCDHIDTLDIVALNKFLCLFFGFGGFLLFVFGFVSFSFSLFFFSFSLSFLIFLILFFFFFFLFVFLFLPDSAAEEAGLQVGDILIAVNGTDVTSMPHSEAANLARKGNSESQ